MRKAAFAGMFYPGTMNALNKTLEECFKGKFGPGVLPVRPRPGALPVKAIITPHAGYTYSGMAAAWGYKALAETELPDLFILIGPNHRDNKSGISIDSFETPLGLVRSDQDFAKALTARGNIKINEQIHANEHSLEVQLPFLQFVFANQSEKIKIISLLVSDDLDLDKAARDLKETISELRRRVTFIISSDFTHYGHNYGFVPFTENIKENLSKLDNGAFDLIKKGDAKGFEKYVHETRVSICGYLPIILLLKTIDFKSAVLEQYYTSGDLTDDYNTSVSYASIVFR